MDSTIDAGTGGNAARSSEQAAGNVAPDASGVAEPGASGVDVPAPAAGPDRVGDRFDTSVEELRHQVGVLAGLLDRHALRTRDALELARTRRLDLERSAAERARLEGDLERTRRAFAGFKRRRSVRVAVALADRMHPLVGSRPAAPGAIAIGRPSAPGPGSGAPSGRPPGSPVPATPVETGTVGAGDPCPALLDGDGPSSFRHRFLGRLAATPGTTGLRILPVASIGGDEPERPATPPAGGWPDVVVLDSPDLDIRRLPRHVVTVARPGRDLGAWLAAAWFDQLDVVIVPDAEAAGTVSAASAKTACVEAAALLEPPDGPAVRAALETWATACRFAIMVQPPTWAWSATSGDYWFARALQRQLERRGHPTGVYLLRQWPLPATSREDVVLHLWGRYALATRPGQANALWVLYHPELVTPELLDRYDHVFAGSEALARTLAAATAVRVEPLHQAADPEAMAPRGPAPHHELLFIGNSRGTRRTILDDLGPTARGLAVYGGGWANDLLDPAYLRGDRVPHEDLGSYYHAADIVLNDHWPEAAEAGLITNRLYDTLAAGGFAISDPVPGIEAEFDGGVVTYAGPADLALKVERYLADPEARRAVAARGRAAVLERHTFSARASRLVEVLLPLAGAAAARQAAAGPNP